MGFESTIIGKQFLDSVPRHLKLIEHAIDALKYPYPDLCSVCKNRDDKTKRYCVLCVPRNDKRASNFIPY